MAVSNCVAYCLKSGNNANYVMNCGDCLNLRSLTATKIIPKAILNASEAKRAQVAMEGTAKTEWK